MLWSPHWSGIIGTHPGTGSGSQTIEAFHSVWQQYVKDSTRNTVTTVFDLMDRMYKNEWNEKFKWETYRSYQLYPKRYDPNIQSLKPNIVSNPKPQEQAGKPASQEASRPAS